MGSDLPSTPGDGGRQKPIIIKLVKGTHKYSKAHLYQRSLEDNNYQAVCGNMICSEKNGHPQVWDSTNPEEEIGCKKCLYRFKSANGDPAKWITESDLHPIRPRGTEWGYGPIAKRNRYRADGQYPEVHPSRVPLSVQPREDD